LTHQVEQEICHSSVRHDSANQRLRNGRKNTQPLRSTIKDSGGGQSNSLALDAHYMDYMERRATSTEKHEYNESSFLRPNLQADALKKSGTGPATSKRLKILQSKRTSIQLQKFIEKKKRQ